MVQDIIYLLQNLRGKQKRKQVFIQCQKLSLSTPTIIPPIYQQCFWCSNYLRNAMTVNIDYDQSVQKIKWSGVEGGSNGSILF